MDTSSRVASEGQRKVLLCISSLAALARWKGGGAPHRWTACESRPMFCPEKLGEDCVAHPAPRSTRERTDFGLVRSNPGRLELGLFVPDIEQQKNSLELDRDRAR